MVVEEQGRSEGSGAVCCCGVRWQLRILMTFTSHYSAIHLYERRQLYDTTTLMKRARGMSVRESVFDEGSAEQHNKSRDKVLPQSGAEDNTRDECFR